jgi:hypothetical protein
VNCSRVGFSNSIAIFTQAGSATLLVDDCARELLVAQGTRWISPLDFENTVPHELFDGYTISFLATREMRSPYAGTFPGLSERVLETLPVLSFF